MEKHLNLVGDCDVCQKAVEVKLVKEQGTFKVRDLDVEAELTIPYCLHCGEVVTIQSVEDANYKIVYEKYKELKGLLTAVEIISIRQKFSLSASDFAIILGFGEKTITRYENGYIQESSHDSLIRHATQPHFLVDLYQRQKQYLSEKTRVNFTVTMLKYGIVADRDPTILKSIPLYDLPQVFPVQYNQVILHPYFSTFPAPRRKSKCNITAI